MMICVFKEQICVDNLCIVICFSCAFFHYNVLYVCITCIMAENECISLVLEQIIVSRSLVNLSRKSLDHYD